MCCPIPCIFQYTACLLVEGTPASHTPSRMALSTSVKNFTAPPSLATTTTTTYQATHSPFQRRSLYKWRELSQLFPTCHRFSTSCPGPCCFWYGSSFRWPGRCCTRGGRCGGCWCLGEDGCMNDADGVVIMVALLTVTVWLLVALNTVMLMVSVSVDVAICVCVCVNKGSNNRRP